MLASLSAQDAKQMLHLGRSLASYGMVNQGEMQGGLLRAVLEDGEKQTSEQSDTVDHAHSNMTTTEFQHYLKFMGKRMAGASQVVQEDVDNIHKEEIAIGMAKTAEFVENLSKKKEQDIALKAQMQQEIEQQQHAHLEKQQAAEKDPKNIGLSLGSSIGGILDEMVQVLGGSFGESSHALKADVAKAASGLQGCKESGGRYSDKSTPANALPVKGHAMPFPKQ